VPAARLADVGTRDAHPPVLGRRLDHPPQELTIAPLQLRALDQHESSRGDPRRQRVAHPLELTEIGDARRGKRSGNRGLDRHPRKRLGLKGGELSLEAADLPPQLGSGEALVAPHPRGGKRLPVEQIQHPDRV
jgi:hypothetical protein